MSEKKPLLLLIISLTVILLISGVIVITVPSASEFINQEIANEKLHSQLKTLRQRLPQTLSDKLGTIVVLGSVDFNVSKFESREELQILIDELFKMPEEELPNHAIINTSKLGSDISCSFIPPEYNNITDKKLWVLIITTINPDRTVNTCDVLYYDRAGKVVEETHHQGKSFWFSDFSKQNK